MRLLTPLLLAALLPASALAAELTLQEYGALHPDRSCFTLHEDLDRVGLSPFAGDIDPASHLDGRGGGWEVNDVGDISFVSGPWDYNTLSGDALYGSLNEFLAEHFDEYDFVTMFVTEHLNFGALYSPLQNNNGGIGQQQFDQTTTQGYGELEGFLFMNSIFDYTGSLHDALFFGQEVGHRWGSFVRRAGGGGDMLGRDDAHWSFFMDTDNSTMEGNDWVSIASDRWETNVDTEIGYSELDLYLMGFIPPEDVDDWLLIGDPVVMSNPYQWGEGNITPSTTPYYVIRQYVDNGGDYPVVVRGNEINVRIEDVVSVNGPRTPSSEDSQREFRMAFVIMQPANDRVDFDDYLVIEDTREELAGLWSDMVGGRATLDTTLGTSGLYELNPSSLPIGIAYEPAIPEPGSRPGGVSGAGCRSSVAGAGAVTLGLPLLLLGLRRRRS